MNARLDLFGNQVAARFSRHIVSAGKVLADSTLPAAAQELVKIRVSQINGCAFCVDMHTKDAAHAGETSTRLSLVAAWREATVFTEAERTALEQLATAAGATCGTTTPSGRYFVAGDSVPFAARRQRLIAAVTASPETPRDQPARPAPAAARPQEPA